MGNELKHDLCGSPLIEEIDNAKWEHFYYIDRPGGYSLVSAKSDGRVYFALRGGDSREFLPFAFDNFCFFNDGYVCVSIDNAFWVFDVKEKRHLFSVNADCICEFRTPLGFIVKRDKKYNIITNSGEFVSPTWFDYIEGTYSNIFGSPLCRLNDKWNFLTDTGRTLTDRWFDKYLWHEKGGNICVMQDAGIFYYVYKDGYYKTI